MTDRQFAAWQAWTEKDLNTPGKQETYLMQIAAECRRQLVKDPNSVQISDMKLEWQEPPPPLSLEQASAICREKWSVMYRVKGKPRK